MSGIMVETDRLSKRFGDTLALDDVTVEIATGEFFALLGPSGCGKTTLLRTVAGLVQPDGGSVRVDGQRMDGVAANRRPTNMVFQNYAIFPHLDVARNVGFGLRKLRLSKAEQDRRVADALNMVNLDGYQARDARTLSGGQRQRVALARALVLRPKVLLLDEPMSALDRQLRIQMQGELRNLQRAVGITFVLVTHDQQEALSLSNRVAVMFDGAIAQVGGPQEIYRTPVSRKVAEFIGSMNFLDARLLSEEGQNLRLEVQGFGQVSVPKPATGHANPQRCFSVGIRPETLSLHGGTCSGSEHCAQGRINDVKFLGDKITYDIEFANGTGSISVAHSNSDPPAALAAGSPVVVELRPESVRIFPD